MWRSKRWVYIKISILSRTTSFISLSFRLSFCKWVRITDFNHIRYWDLIYYETDQKHLNNYDSSMLGYEVSPSTIIQLVMGSTREYSWKCFFKWSEMSRKNDDNFNGRGTLGDIDSSSWVKSVSKETNVMCKILIDPDD